ncbi:MAG TPA: T9SS type A sorting domain-containing protein [Ignavibacteria bacterium]|nr:T9SS type A sorting domain-containing protein [Ignavibacteria bacterium]
MDYTRDAHSSIILNNGYILLTGGQKGNDTWELYDPILFKNIYSDNFPVVQGSQRIEKLPNGGVISMGGITWRGSSLPVISSTAMSEIYLTVTGIKTELQNSSNMFELLQNYPNPFNPETAISFKLSSLSFVTLKVFDVLGREVATLVNEEKPTGKYVVKFNANNLPSGVYFYTINANNFHKVKKMILLR